MNWLNQNAAAIQALSGIAALIVTGVLAWLTWNYVRLTREIARSSLEQVKYIREAARSALRQNAKALGSLALRLRVGLGQLDSTSPNDGQLRAFAQLAEQDITELQSLARQLNTQTITSASDAAAHLRIIYDMVQVVKKINEGIGWIPDANEKTRWKKAIEGAHRALHEIETACQQAAES
jgi:hypothetical protein